MTVEEAKARLVAQINQATVNSLVEQLAKLMLEHDAIKAELTALKATHKRKAKP